MLNLVVCKVTADVWFKIVVSLRMTYPRPKHVVLLDTYTLFFF
jgi:hypothetical protein